MLARRSAPFKWGENDCALFAADGIEAITGVDIAQEFRGTYTTEAGALARIAAVCGGSTVADAAVYCAEKHGLVEWKFPLMAQRGDLVVFQNGANLIAGLVHLAGRHIVAVGPGGLFRFPIAEVDEQTGAISTAIARAWHYE